MPQKHYDRARRFTSFATQDGFPITIDTFVKKSRFEELLRKFPALADRIEGSVIEKEFGEHRYISGIERGTPNPTILSVARVAAALKTFARAAVQRRSQMKRRKSSKPSEDERESACLWRIGSFSLRRLVLRNRWVPHRV